MADIDVCTLFVFYSLLIEKKRRCLMLKIEIEISVYGIKFTSQSYNFSKISLSLLYHCDTDEER